MAKRSRPHAEVSTLDEMPEEPSLANRKGARRRSEIPPVVLAALNNGDLATVNLVETLAIDMAVLVREVFWRLSQEKLAKQLEVTAKVLSEQGIMQRLAGMGQAIAASLSGGSGQMTFESLATHASDTVRSWACFAAQAHQSTKLASRLSAARRFAADPHFGVRECAWMSVRPYFAEQLEQAIDLLQPWVVDPDPNIRRFAIESTRPRGVWCAHLVALKAEPEQASRLLEPVRSDPSRYVQSSVANWLNDASKSQPAWVQKLCRRWEKESPSKETVWVVKRALRSIKPAKPEK
jgi:3-methyladenine DNA glycosylase AlkC